jgi:lipopolysaccharide export system protein LptA
MTSHQAQRFFAVAGAIALLAGAARPAAAQDAPRGTCVLEWQSRPDGRLRIAQQPDGTRNFYFGGGFTGICRAQSITVQADSAEYFESGRLVHLYHNVDYREPRVTVTSNRATYWLNTELIRAEGNVVATLPSGTTLRGPTLDYYRAAPPVRAESRMVAPGRPTIDVVDAGASARPAEPVRVVANTVIMQGEDMVYASGRVVITRPDLVARGDSAVLNQATEHARLMRDPFVEGRGERPFTLRGRVVDVYARQRALERVVASAEARATSDDVTITGDTIDFRLTDGRVQRGYVWGGSRARAVSPEYDILADSLDVLMPNQQLEEVRAVGQAFATSRPDTLRFVTEERDWMRGDSIYAYFDTAAPPAPNGQNAENQQPPVRQLLAVGSASSFYQTAANDTTVRQPAINYVRGRTIALGFEDGEVRQVLVTEQVSGVYLEPNVVREAPEDGTAPPPQQRSRTGAASGRPRR